ncbi:hypothetical protein CVD28_02215 [Bacillus sp. M6-12]|uniref:AbrB/MazE/SpoVT family DNA-binding domain-containing protein n=1 Tax=Bacillus sp. M6-12 TaxID=2054166 RepID=UPI000C791818|nr:AbrB/MazE/SpoVT family DNA-binding domain-containing protein [Bacillus sp. M6-12]PLS19247.1 hypothetical protein CVD28_02215 [Bacillus sp. M6-12]
MGNPALFGMKKDGQYRVTYVHNFGGFMDGLSYSTMYHVCKFVHQLSNEELTNMFHHIITDNEEENIDDIMIKEEEKFINQYGQEMFSVMREISHGADSELIRKRLKDIEHQYKQMKENVNEYKTDEFPFYQPSEIQYLLIDFLSEASSKMVASNGKMIIPDYSDALDSYSTHFIIDLDDNVLDILHDYNIFKLSFSKIRESSIENVEKSVHSFGNIFYALDGHLEEDEYLERYDSGKMTQKGQLTIPVEVREALDMKEGDRLEFGLSHHEVVSVKVKEKKSITAVRGILNYEAETE